MTEIAAPLDEVIAMPEADDAPIDVPETAVPKKPDRSRKTPAPLVEHDLAVQADRAVTPPAEPMPERAPEPAAAKPSVAKKPKAKPAPVALVEVDPEPESDPNVPAKRGWWSRATGR